MGRKHRHGTCTCSLETSKEGTEKQADHQPSACVIYPDNVYECENVSFSEYTCSSQPGLVHLIFWGSNNPSTWTCTQNTIQPFLFLQGCPLYKYAMCETSTSHMASMEPTLT